MRVAGHYELAAPRDAVFAAIHDPTVLLTMLPGCREISRVNATEYRGTMVIRLPAIVGTYRTMVRLVDSTAPSFSRFEGQVDGRVGSLAGTASFVLTEVGQGTAIDYEGEARISGPLARLDSRFLEGLCRSLINEGLGRLNERLQRQQMETAS